MSLNNVFYSLYVGIVRAVVIITVFNVFIIFISILEVKRNFQAHMLNIIFYILNLLGLFSILKSKLFPKFIYMILLLINSVLLLLLAINVFENYNTLALSFHKVLYLFCCIVIFLTKLFADH